MSLRISRSFTSLAAMALVLGTPALAQEATNIAYLSFNGTVQAHELAEELGYFEGTDVTLEAKGYSSGGPESLMAMAAGDIQVGVVATAAILNAVAGGMDLVATYPSQGMRDDVVSKYYVLEDSPIQSLADLAGTTIAINTLGAQLDFVVREAVASVDVPLQSVKMITVPTPQLEQVLRSGQADVVAVGYWANTFQGAMEEAGGVRTLFTDLDIIGELSGGFAIMNRDFVEAHEDAVRTFTLQSARALEFSREHPAEAREAIARVLERRGENADMAQFFLGYGVRDGGLGTEQDVAFWIDVMSRAGLIPADIIDPADLLFMTIDDIQQ